MAAPAARGDDPRGGFLSTAVYRCRSGTLDRAVDAWFRVVGPEAPGQPGLRDLAVSVDRASSTLLAQGWWESPTHAQGFMRTGIFTKIKDALAPYLEGEPETKAWQPLVSVPGLAARHGEDQERVQPFLPEEVLESFGAPVIIKRVPGLEGPDRLDPRERALGRFPSLTSPGKTPPASVSGPASPMDGLRASMGFANTDLCRTEIETTWYPFPVAGLPPETTGLWAWEPRHRRGGPGTLCPAMLYIHGGGFVGGSPRTLASALRLLAEQSGAVVLGLRYPLAPEHPFPAAPRTARAALDWIRDRGEALGIDPARIFVGGDSAGGNLAAALAQEDRDRGSEPPLAGQALIYPLVTMRPQGFPELYWDLGHFAPHPDEATEIEPMLGLGRPDHPGNGDWFMEQYVPQGTDPDQPALSPLRGRLEGLCPALVALAQWDGLRVQGEFYAARLREAGVAVRTLRYAGVGHAFFDKLGYLPQAQDLVTEIARFMTP